MSIGKISSSAKFANFRSQVLILQNEQILEIC